MTSVNMDARRHSTRSLAPFPHRDDLLDEDDIDFTCVGYGRVTVAREDASIARRAKLMVEEVRELVVRQRQKEKEAANKRLRCDYSWLQDSQTLVRQRTLSPRSARVVVAFVAGLL